jgi:hypothetical protein
MQTIKINVSKIDKTALFPGKNGKYLDLVLFENKAGPDDYGNDGFVTQDIGKARREAGERGPILGNWKRLQPKSQSAPQPTAPPKHDPFYADDDDSDIPF